ncbi:SusC/RagA family TonB-linked outer membrane protein [Olivibacter sitiensis]|uniref:SusC/RagA family TonB-linked outer membrane protein n=1 Tax=Olivibacter sitiensis TaxID=376470 RepID=UPI00040ECACD|nr:TonB-dependent receptor [Olivibacter sitiensis]
MKRKLLFILMWIGIFYTGNAFSQEKTVSGKVSATDGTTLPGVSVLLPGTTIGTTTDSNGNFSLKVPESATRLVFQYLGYVRKEATITGNFLEVSLENDEENRLDEVLVVGYGTQIRRKSTDNIARITASDMADVPSPSFQSLLSGKAAGVQVMQTNGKVESGMTIRVRGVSSISAGSDPLYVLDGMPLINQNESNYTAPTNPLLTLSPSEIESIDILKDAAATAIYGSRGANGVIIITTKSGKEGRNVLNANVSQGFSSPTRLREWLNADEYIELFTEAAINRYGLEDGTDIAEETFDWLAVGTDWRNREVNTDWQDLAFQNGRITDFDLSLSGGNQKTKYFFSGAYNKTDGIIRSNDLDRISSRINVSHELSSKFTAGANLSFSRTGINRVSNDNAFTTPLQSIAQAPISPAYLEDGEPNPNTLYANYLLQDKHAFYNTMIRRVTGKAFAEYRFLPNLKFNSDFGYDLFYQTEDQFVGSQAPFQSTNGESYASSVGTESYIFSNYLSFNKTFAEIHDLDVVAGMEFNDRKRRFQDATGIEFPSDDLITLRSAAEITAADGTVTQNNFLSYFARATYSLYDRYLLKASIRRDGSSRFGTDNRYGFFPAFSAGWIVSEESFLKDSQTLSFLKLKGSWGKTGNAEIGDFASLGLFTGAAYNQTPGLAPSQAANPILTWESIIQSDIGLEFGLLSDRLTGEVSYYTKKSDGLLFNQLLPYTSGLSSITKNLGIVENKGIEFALTSKNINKEGFSWNTNFNLANNKNKITELPNGDDVIDGRNILREGNPIYAFYILEYAGVNPDNGDGEYYVNSVNEDGSLNKERTANANAANRIIAGSPIPNWIGGITNTIRYKDIDFSFTFQGEWGASIYNGGGVYQSANMIYEDNQTKDQLRRWQNPGDITDVPQARLYLNNGAQHSTRYLEKADFIRLRNINLGYTLPKSFTQKIGVSNARVYASGFNLITITNYSGYDPEARSDAGASQAARGIDFYSAPAAKTYSFGINVTF